MKLKEAWNFVPNSGNPFDPDIKQRRENWTGSGASEPAESEINTVSQRFGPDFLTRNRRCWYFSDQHFNRFAAPIRKTGCKTVQPRL